MLTRTTLAAVLGLVGCAPAFAHDHYTGIFNFNGVGCCTGQDCQQAADPKDFEPIAGGYKLRSTGEVVPRGKTGFSPDANWHVCRSDTSKRTIRCLLVPARTT